MAHLSVGGEAPATPAMEVEEHHDYDFDGMLENASMAIVGNEGTSRWLLVKESRAGWKLSITSAGVENARQMADIHDNLEKTFLLCRGVKTRTIKVGDVFCDTSFELESGTSVPEKTRCIGLPGKGNGYRWVFLDSLLQREDTLKIDTSGAIVYEEMYPFIAKKKSKAGNKATASILDLADELAIPADRAAREGERIALVLDSLLSPDSSVACWYRRHGDAWVLSDIPGNCATRPAGGSLRQADSFTQPTVTMQSDNAKIKKLADSIVKSCADRCDSIDACFRWVYVKLDKKITPTFSNALETLEAGYGDCSEHAVLLGALLRAVGIPARVILGLVYSPGRKGYYYHAWVMAWSNGARVFVDPALGVFPASRDRIPLLIDDNGSGAVRAAPFIGRIKIRYEK